MRYRLLVVSLERNFSLRISCWRVCTVGDVNVIGGRGIWFYYFVGRGE